jgi:hypothetical protein
MGVCQATAENHCCWVPGVGVCPHFNPTPPKGAGGFCSLRTELGSWEAVHESDKYAPQRAAFESFGTHGGTSLCGDFPRASESPCATCGAIADG